MAKDKALLVRLPPALWSVMVKVKESKGISYTWQIINALKFDLDLDFNFDPKNS